jgi:prepilin-type N-terminal cleavage/methylation domain-containing protein
MRRRPAFTLIEVLVSVALLALVLMGLYESLDLQRTSNKQLHDFLQKTMQRDRVALTLYRDLLASNGDLTLHKGEFDRLCIRHTAHSLYALPVAQVCWIVDKEANTLTRIEGSDYHLPLKREERVAIDRVLPDMTLFDLYRKNGDLLVALQAKGSKAYTFLVQGLTPPPKRKKPSKTPPEKKPKSRQP